MDYNTLNFARWSDRSFINKRLSARKGYFTLCPLWGWHSLSVILLTHWLSLVRKGDTREVVKFCLISWSNEAWLSVLSGGPRHELVKRGARQQQLSHQVWGPPKPGTTTHRSTFMASRVAMGRQTCGAAFCQWLWAGPLASAGQAIL